MVVYNYSERPKKVVIACLPVAPAKAGLPSVALAANYVPSEFRRLNRLACHP